MNNRKPKLRFILLLLLCMVALAGWRFLGSNTTSKENQVLFIPTGSDFQQVMNTIREEHLLKNPVSFSWAAGWLNYKQTVKPGKYLVTPGTSIFQLIRILRSGRQTPVKLIITKLRTKEDLAKKLGELFEEKTDAFTQLFNDNNRLQQFGLDTNTVLTAIIPNTYLFFWNTRAEDLLQKLVAEKNKFWNQERQQAAAQLHFSQPEVYTLASIVEEETRNDEDRGKVASVYLNRLQQGMRLGADPTVIFALKDFSMHRVLKVHTQVQSPYNTYLISGLPPGPICTPSVKSIDAVLHAPATDYLYFVAQPNLTGRSNFARTYDEHLTYAKAYQSWLTEYMKQKNQTH